MNQQRPPEPGRAAGGSLQRSPDNLQGNQYESRLEKPRSHSPLASPRGRLGGAGVRGRVGGFSPSGESIKGLA